MDAVGRLGGILTAPFHPFGGAVDIVVVEQKNGSFKSSPWYVRFGNFQGVLKAKENVVDISVNGERANFHMYLDHRGHAYFLREVDVEEGNMLSPKSPIEAMDGRDRRPVKANSWNYGDSVKQIEVSNGKVLARSGSRRARLMGLVFGRKSMKEDKNQEDNGRRDSFERAEFAADLLDMNWSTNLGPVRKERSNASSISDAGNVETGAFKGLSTVHCETLDPLEIEMDDFGERADLKCDEVSVQEETSPNLESAAEASSEVESRQLHETFGDGSELTSTFLEHASALCRDKFTKEVESFSALTNSSSVDSLSDVQCDLSIRNEDEMGSCQLIGEALCGSLEVDSDFPTEAFNSSSSVGLEEGKPLCSDLNDAKRGEITCAELISLDYTGKENCFSLVSKDIKSANGSFNTDFENLSCNEVQERSNQVNTLRSNKEVPDHELGGPVRSLPITIKSQFDESSEHFLRRPLGHSLVFNLKSSKWALLRESVSFFIKSDAKSVERLSSSQSITVDDLNFEVLKNIDDAPMNVDKILAADSPKLVKTSSGSWTGQPFTSKRSRSMKDTQLGLNCTSLGTEISLEDTMGMHLQNEVSSPKLTKKNIRVTSPTTEQLASLNLKEGCNSVTFTFSTPMLGKQQVGARVYLWRWDTRVVITDVDGTITKSDVLGQFMPLVGRDWSQTGVAHLFSAIKENGYQLLFLSARAISQAGLTRRFLFNLKQDGKGLPDGPVVISPDGIFPSLFREIIRRAPHEFKIACLEDIKACFPSDRNPFYAGFGNRDTDEFSYLKVGIPIGKIFIINPKGEVVVNRCDNKSYTSLHALVNGMFPPMSSEQEDFNSWNFWKLPPRVINV